MSKLTIVAVNRAGSHKQHSISSFISQLDIQQALGFGPNISDDPGKVKHSWGFTANGQHCGIWDYKGSRWSAYGPLEVFVELFGAANVREG